MSQRKERVDVDFDYELQEMLFFCWANRASRIEKGFLDWGCGQLRRP